jgi:hypothetical protein
VERALAGHLLLAGQGPLHEVPLLADLLAGERVAPLSAEQYDQLDAMGLPLPEPPTAECFAETTTVAAPPLPAVEATQVVEPATLSERAVRPDDLHVPLDQRRTAAELFVRACQVMNTTGDSTYALHLLRTSCRLDPISTEHRKKLREVGRLSAAGKRGGLFGSLSSLPARGRMRAARHAGDHGKVLEHGEEVLARLPGDIATQLDMADSAEALGSPSLAVWLLKEAVHDAPEEPTLLRALARLCERLGRFEAAVGVWQQVHQLVRTDQEAASKIKELAARQAIARTASALG